MDKLKVSHVDPFKIMKFSVFLYNIYGGIYVHQVKVHYYLVMDIYYYDQDNLKLPMIKYVNNVLKKLP